MNKNHKLLMCAAGIFVCYFYFGILQEKITRGTYSNEEKDEDGKTIKTQEKFTYMLALVCAQCIVNYIFAKGMLAAWHLGEDKTPQVYCASAALTYLLAMVCSYMALQWVSYPTQVVGKSAKPIPVMILGVLIGRRSYPVMKYVFVVVIVTGVVLFMLKEGGAGAAGKDDSNWIGLGELLIALSLTMDGLTGAVQERMRAEYSPTAQHMMLFMNKWSAVFLLAALAGTGEGWHFLKFIGRHPVCLSHIAQLAVAGALGQLCIFLTVSEFGPLPCSIVTTTRKFFTVLASVALFGNVLTPRQWLGAATVFTGLFLDVYFSKASAKNK